MSEGRTLLARVGLSRSSNGGSGDAWQDVEGGAAGAAASGGGAGGSAGAPAPFLRSLPVEGSKYYPKRRPGSGSGGGGGGGGFVAAALRRASFASWLMPAMVLTQMLTILYLLRLRLPALDGGLAVGGGGGGAAAVRRHAAAAPPVHFVRAGAARLLTHLIMVPGHAITMGDGLAAAPETDEAWHLLDYQREHDVGITFVDHIQGGVTLAAADTAALLLFSGGQTRADAGPKSEGFSYFAVAEANSWWGQPQVRGRAASEEFARDSFENLLFSVARFREITGHYPEKITIVGYDFKRDRYVNQHAAALRYPARAVSYLGIAPRGARFDTAGATAGEAAHAALPFKTDPYGCGSPVLADKRRDRNPYAREPPYPLTAPEMAELLRWCGPGIYAGALPWDPPAAEGGKEEGAGGKAAAAA